jgi:hypothetical protein
MADQPIPVENALQMIEQYLGYMQEHDIDMEQQTHCVSFNFSELQNWLRSVQDYSDELRIFLGVYPSGEYEGRITTILWPYKDGSPAVMPPEQGEIQIEPYNDGVLHP